MINYDKSAFGWNLLFRLHGSAVYRATIFGLLSCGFLLLLKWTWYEQYPEQQAKRALGHPYAIGVLVAAISFLLVFRVQNAYGRYWEATSAVYRMTSKWTDAAVLLTSFHLQCEHYDTIRPPSYFEYPALNDRYLTRERESAYDNAEDLSLSRHGQPQDAESVHHRAVHKSIENVQRKVSKKRYVQRRPSTRFRINTGDASSETEIRRPTMLMGEERLDGHWSGLFDDGKATYCNLQHPLRKDANNLGFASTQGGRTPVLFLQELTHLTSLLLGVAYSTLRNDIEGAESPLGIYGPGSCWPAVDPDADRSLFYHHQGMASCWYKFLRFVGVGRSPEDRTRYNASRPMPVLGGVSTGEIRFLQTARGPYAKTQLAWQWLSEFLIRESIAGNTGKVHSAIISRCIQNLGDGMIFYNHARKIMFIPYPFVHAQLTTLFVLVMIPAVALLMAQYTGEDHVWLGACLCFFTCTALGGMNEVAREMENPFRNVPNELPLVTLLAQVNENLLTMYAGFQPDFDWRKAAESALERPPPHTTSSKSTRSILAGLMSATGVAAEADQRNKQTSGDVGFSDARGEKRERAATTASPLLKDGATPLAEDVSVEELFKLLSDKSRQQEEQLRRLRKQVVDNVVAVDEESNNDNSKASGDVVFT